MTVFSSLWNPKTPLLWDWESLELFNGRAGEIPKQEQPLDWSVEGAGGIDTGGPICLSGGDGCSASDFGSASSSKSSISASVDSSSKTGIKADVNNRKELGRVDDAGTSMDLLASVGSGEPQIGLKLGKRTYFEDMCAGGAAKASSTSAISASSSNSNKKTRASPQSLHIPRCQVEGCNLDLTAAKDYHRRHRVCENHTKHPKVIVGGQERRFHGLSEFDEKKRSCRRRLSDHNARRRRPQTETISFNSSRLSSSFYDGRQQMNLASNWLPILHERPAINTTSLPNFKIAQAKGSWTGTIRPRGIDDDLHLPSSERSTAVPMLCHDFDKLSPYKHTSPNVLNQGQEASMIAFNSDTTLDSRRALSLLSNASFSSSQPEAAVDQLMHTSNTIVAQPAMQSFHHVSPHVSSEFFEFEPRDLALALHSSNSQFHEFQLFKVPYESTFLNSNHMH
ncbi:hypothetical protein ACLOJK_030897 [Asimina triloba]